MCSVKNFCHVTEASEWSNSDSYLKCSFASRNCSWPNCIKPACWRILLCKICKCRKWQYIRLLWYLDKDLRSHTLYFRHTSAIKSKQHTATWNLSLGIFCCAPSVRTSASSTLWLASKSWICLSSGRGTRTYTAFVEARMTFPKNTQHPQVRTSMLSNNHMGTQWHHKLLVY